MLGNEKLSECCYVWQHFLMKGCHLMQQGEWSLTYTCCMQGIKCCKFIKSNWGRGWRLAEGTVLCFSSIMLRDKAAKEENNFVCKIRSDSSETLYTETMKELHQEFCILYINRYLLLQVLSFGSHQEWVVLSLYTCATVWQLGNYKQVYLKQEACYCLRRIKSSIAHVLASSINR